MTKARLEDWSISGGRVVGAVYNHPRFDDGERIISSPIEKLDLVEMICSTKSGTTYQLGESSRQEPTVFARREDTGGTDDGSPSNVA